MAKILAQVDRIADWNGGEVANAMMAAGRDAMGDDVAVHVKRLKTGDHTTNETLSRHIDPVGTA